MWKRHNRPKSTTNEEKIFSTYRKIFNIFFTHTEYLQINKASYKLINAQKERWTEDMNVLVPEEKYK